MGRKTFTGTSRYPQPQQLIGSILYDLRMMCKGKREILICIKSRLTKFLEMTPKDSNEASSYLDTFLSSRVPEAMVKLYKVRAHDFIQHLITSCKDELKLPIYNDFISRLVLKFYELLRIAVRHGDSLYIFCRASLESILNKTNVIIVQGIFPFVDELASKLSQGLVLSREIRPSSTDVQEFSNLLRFMMNAIVDPKDLDTLIPRRYYHNHAWYDRDQLGYLYSVYLNLMAKLETCLTEMGDKIKVIRNVKQNAGWDQYLPILKQLHHISQLYEGTEEIFWTKVEPHKVALCHLIVEYAKRSNVDDYKWIINHKDLIDFETKRHWVMMFLPEVKKDYRNSQKMFSIIGFQVIIPFVNDLVAKLSHGLVSSSHGLVSSRAGARKFGLGGQSLIYFINYTTKLFGKSNFKKTQRFSKIYTTKFSLRGLHDLCDPLFPQPLDSSMESTGPSSTDVHEFIKFFYYMVNATINSKDLYRLNFVYSIYLNLFEKMQVCLYQMENDIHVKVKRDGGCDQYLHILKILHYTSQLYGGIADTFWTNLRPYKVVLCYLIAEYLKRSDIDDCILIINRKDATYFETMLLSELARDYGNRNNMFLSSGLPEALVRLYTSPHDGKKELARNFIQDIFTSSKDKLKESDYHEVCAPIVLQFYKLLRRDVPRDDLLYIFCRNTLESMLNYLHGASIAVQDIYPFFDGLATKLSKDLVSSMEFAGPCSTDVKEFRIFLRFMMKKHINPKYLDTVVPKQYYQNHPWYDSRVGYLHSLYLHLLTTVKACLNKMGNNITEILKAEQDGRCDQYLPILSLLHSISQLYGGEEENFWTKLMNDKVSLCYLAVRYEKEDDGDYKWILNRKDLTGFETRRHLVMMLLPDVTVASGNHHRMLINRSNLLAESFKLITGAYKASLLGGPISIKFKNEVASGPGVLREWFMLVCQAIFNPHNALFLACPTDRRRFFPNPASEVNPEHLQYFRFAGRVTALALIHKMQVGILFARAFCLQLAGIKEVSLDDINDFDPYLYNSCKQILDMDPCLVDQDVLGLTFTWEFEELGVKKIVQLCPKGEQKSVDSTNRDVYINLVIKHQFVMSIAQQVCNFSEGFADIVGDTKKTELCFAILEGKYLDGMLCGSESDISVDDWKKHTQYSGYTENDPQIHWFWKIVREMSVEQRQVLLFFWTSVKYLPVEGFRGLADNLYINKSDEEYGCLPSSHTCYYQIFIPDYPSMAVMQERLNIITQDWVGCSFGSA